MFGKVPLHHLELHSQWLVIKKPQGDEYRGHWISGFPLQRLQLAGGFHRFLKRKRRQPREKLVLPRLLVEDPVGPLWHETLSFTSRPAV